MRSGGAVIGIIAGGTETPGGSLNIACGSELLIPCVEVMMSVLPASVVNEPEPDTTWLFVSNVPRFNRHGPI